MERHGKVIKKIILNLKILILYFDIFFFLKFKLKKKI